MTATPSQPANFIIVAKAPPKLLWQNHWTG
jgi:hypothetical protein